MISHVMDLTWLGQFHIITFYDWLSHLSTDLPNLSNQSFESTYIINYWQNKTCPFKSVKIWLASEALKGPRAARAPRADIVLALIYLGSFSSLSKQSSLKGSWASQDPSNIG